MSPTFLIPIKLYRDRKFTKDTQLTNKMIIRSTLEAELVIVTKSKHELQARWQIKYNCKKYNMKNLKCSQYFLVVPPGSVKIDLARKKKTTEYISEFKYLASIFGEKKKIVILKLNTSDITNNIIKEAF